MKIVNVIGAGMAGCEATWQLHKRGVQVNLYEQKLLQKSQAHSLDTFAELVCSNSLKSLDRDTASGLLKAELDCLDCLLLRLARQCRVPSGSALAVDRAAFSALVTTTIQQLPNVHIHHQIVDSIDITHPTIIATGPLTEGKLASQIQELTNGFLSFFDAVSPIVEYDSIDIKSCFVQDRYDKHSDCLQQPIIEGDYINCPMTKCEYDEFYANLISADRVQPKEWEKIPYFDSCMPIEIIASKGRDTMRFGPLRPVGFVDPSTGKRPYAVLQLRKENTLGNIYNLVGCQTSLKFAEQKRVFGLVPALRNASYVRYGVMHRNSFVNAPQVLDRHFGLRQLSHIYIAGQLSGLEGYVESIMSGLVAGCSMANRLASKTDIEYPNTTIIGALTTYMTTPNPSYSPMNANFGILPSLSIIRDKQERKKAYANRSLEFFDKVVD
ncbi:MAG: methylenetetrahydrofolate--tRNA-(uracil(54)-C(5))-methyltransferase (FADH(2)-oxidizing) TrmFO [Clostridiales bacterium]|jgi:methylenetetrahydrofolate--tRNA-(uracil-5-)-methyltransferase|nr:methylenetetrahydrofolate--tRNA-(uracil(54)-C(5))-methyltransferase (FADH(2)-oxidizing) TrmFO [Clostridiales bacterium]